MNGLFLPRGSDASAAAPAVHARTGEPSTGDQTAERYFGHRAMSVSEVRAALRDLALHAEVRPEDAGQVFIEAMYIEDALRDWAQKSPNDSSLLVHSFRLADLYRKIGRHDADVRADDTLDLVIALCLRDGRSGARSQIAS